ncbi:acyclic terpene utilization AtuA family protein [Glutamicibacter sp. HZAU]|uniref:acyclic terpene utilization AtuA family protein n=1 Tax=Glutamicibacter sp. HZAU TaxID=2049891 RepID=UPI00191C6AB0|nr:acyclic terpene utilization AtuA family protein [Glutamicibacter sp. HZAU]
MTRTIRLGAGAGFAGDRIDPAVELAQHANLDYLIFEVLGERTIAAAHARRIGGTGVAYDSLLERRFQATLAHSRKSDTTIITNGGAADPEAAGQMALRVARAAGLLGTKVAVVTGDDVLEVIRALDPVLWETGKPLSAEDMELVSANAYLGAEPIIEALNAGADIVIAGRVADPALYLAPIAYEHQWDLANDWDLLGNGILVGHLLECAGQITGGYYADPVIKPVPDMETLGFPFADVARDGSALLSKLDHCGGSLTTRTAAEQLFYEVADPHAYVTPDVVADFSKVQLSEAGENTVRVHGAGGHRKPEQLKVTLGFKGGWIGEGQISYAGPRAYERAQLAAEIVTHRLVAIHGMSAESISVEYIGAGAALRGMSTNQEGIEIRLRVSARVDQWDHADAVGWEIEALYTNGPAAGGGVRRSIQEVLAVRSCYIPREFVQTKVQVEEA